MSQGQKPFHARPFWRNYVVGYLWIGLGIVVLDALSPAHADVIPWTALPMICIGVIIVTCALGWSIRSTFLGRGRKT